MYAFSLKPTGRKVDADVAPPPPTHIIRAPCEMAATPPPPPFSSETDELQLQRRDSGLSASSSSQQQQQQQQRPFTNSPAGQPPVQVHSVSAYTDMRDAADWSAAVQRERTEKRLRALALHEAAKAEEQHRREEAEGQSRREALRRKEERQQLRAAQKEEGEMAAFQARNTQFLRNQQRLIDLSSSVKHAEAQRSARAKEAMFQTWTNSRAGAAAMCSTAGWVSPSSTAASQRLREAMVGEAGTLSQRPTATATTTISTFNPTASSVVPAKEAELRDAAQRTEDAYVQLSLAYRNEAHRSRATANTLAAAGTQASAGRTEQSSCASLPVSALAPSSMAPLPFRTAPAMHCHDDAAHMGVYANEIPTTFIPEYFDDGRGGGSGSGSYGGATLLQRSARAPARSPAEVMPLPLRPSPVSQAVSDGLRDTYYPWAALADATTATARPRLPSRDAYLPVQRWGAEQLHASVYGHGTNPDGSVQEACERRKDFAALRSFTTIPLDNATAMGNSTEAAAPLRSGKRMEVWL